MVSTTTTFLSLLLSLSAAVGTDPVYVQPPSSPGATEYIFPADAASLLLFKSRADLDNKLLYELNERYDYCQWQGVKCAQGRVVRFVLKGFGLRGVLVPNALTRLDQLRVLSLQSNSLSGPLPDFSLLVNLKSLFLSHNGFSGSFPPSILSLHRLTILDVSYNNLTGSIPVQLNGLARLSSLRLEFNRFNGSLPPLNQSFLVSFSVSSNNLTGKVPVTPTLSRFDTTSFSLNPNLCGEIINRACASHSPFFEPPNASSSQAPLGQIAQIQGGGSGGGGGGSVVLPSSSSRKKRNRNGVMFGFTIGVALLIASIILIFTLVKKRSGKSNPQYNDSNLKEVSITESQENPRIETGSVAEVNNENKRREEQSSNRDIQFEQRTMKVSRSGTLVFSSREDDVYTMEQLMRASAELLGRGTMGTTYKAVLDNRLILTVKRLDANKTAVTSSEMFDEHMEIVGGLRHPNLVPIRAYFQAKGERLVIYDYQPNGSLFNLIHGSRSSRAKPLHWTSCLKIAEDVAQGLAYIHQASSKLIHGNLKSSNVILGPDFEACLTDYCLTIIADSSSSLLQDPDSIAYKPPETRNSSTRTPNPNPNSDVYAFGVLVLELLTGKHPSQHPFVAPHDMLDWVRVMREDNDEENNGLGMLTEVASVCSVTSPEQRPAMWQVLRMIQQIKESVMVDGNDSFGYS